MSDQYRSGFEELAKGSKLYPQESLMKVKKSSDSLYIGIPNPIFGRLTYFSGIYFDNTFFNINFCILFVVLFDRLCIDNEQRSNCFTCYLQKMVFISNNYILNHFIFIANHFWAAFNHSGLCAWN